MDFWRVFDGAYDAVADETRAEVNDHPVFGPMLTAIPVQARSLQEREARERLRRAVDGDWSAYEQNLRRQGLTYAQMGIAFREWSVLLQSLERALFPRLVAALVGEPARLSAALLVMSEMYDTSMAVLAESYLDAKEVVLRESERRLAVTLDSIGDAVVATDTDGRVTRMNPVACRLTGWTLEEAQGRPLDEVFRIRSEETGDRAASPVETVLREGCVVGLANHTELVARDGVVRPIADSAAPIRGDDGQVLGVVMVFRDQTHEREAAEERVRAARLEGENRRIQEANRLKSEFLANMSHELRTPLNAIIGFSQLLVEGDVGPLTPPQATFLGHVLSSGRHLLQLINDVLDLAKVEAGKMEFDPERVHVGRLVSDLVASFAAQARAKDLTLEADCADLEVTTDTRRLTQVVNNFLSNAVKFTPRGGRVTARVLTDGDGCFRVEVADTGIGIDPSDLARLFVEFQQLESGTAKEHPGTGLGLALTRRLVEAQGGRVGVESQPGRGSVFYAVLPGLTTRQDASPAEEPGLGNVRPAVLVVAYETEDAACITGILDAAGYRTDVASTAEDAMRLVGERAYDAVTFDLALPEAPGLGVVRAIRESRLNSGVPIVGITLVADDGVACFVVDDVLPKPVSAEALLSALDRLGVSAGAPILVVDDDAASLALMSATIEKLGFRAVCAMDAELGLSVAETARPRAVVLDLLLPGMNGFEFLERFRRSPENARVPVLVWTIHELTRAERERLLDHVRAVIPKVQPTGESLISAVRRHIRPRAGGRA